MPASLSKIVIRNSREIQAMNTKPTHQQKIQLIGCVEKEKCLYDKMDPNYSNRDMKDGLWNSIAYECEIESGSIAREQWTKLRSGYITALNTKKKKWPYYKLLRFLKSFIHLRRTPPEIVIEDDDNIRPQRLIEPSVEPSTSTSNLQQYDMSIHNELSSSSSFTLLNCNEPEVSLEPPPQSVTTQVPNNKLTKFLEYVYSTANDFPPNLQLHLIKKISDLLFEMQETPK